MKGELNMLGVHVLSVRISSVLVCIFSASSVLEQMIGVQVLSVRTSSVFDTYDWCTFTVSTSSVFGRE